MLQLRATGIEEEEDCVEHQVDSNICGKTYFYLNNLAILPHKCYFCIITESHDEKTIVPWYLEAHTI
jgi:hypothetical protein